MQTKQISPGCGTVKSGVKNHSRASALHLLAFSGRSLFRSYGMAFLWQVGLRHPVKVFRGLRRYARFLRAGEGAREVYTHWPAGVCAGGAETLVGVGFCLKPLAPACPSGRSNHACQYFERARWGEAPEHPACAGCRIREYGLLAMARGCHFYLMTSARDILRDVFLPALRAYKFRRGLFTLCRYSFDPFVLPLMMAGMQYALVPFESGDCRDYRTWLQADVGVKPDQTVLAPRHHQMFASYLAAPADGQPRARAFRKTGEVFAPVLD